MHDTSPAVYPSRWTLRDLPLAARLSLAVFLLSVGLGYLSALVNLHFQEASGGELLPTEDDVIRAYNGKAKTSQFERLLIAHPSLPFNGQGSMRAAFIGLKSSGWNRDVKNMAKQLNLDVNNPSQKKQAELAVQAERDGERLSLIAWARTGFDKQAYEDNAFTRPPGLAKHPVTARYVDGDNVLIKSIIQDRCARCHSDSVGGSAARFPLDDYQEITHYTSTEKSTGKSLAHLALTTHVHLLSFAVLYGLTGLALALSSCPAWIRVPIAPLALIASVVDIGFWWLARLEEPYGPMFSTWIALSGAVGAMALGLQIILTTFSMFGKVGKVVLVLLFIAAGAGGYYAKENIVDPYILHEKEMMKSVTLDPSELRLE